MQNPGLLDSSDGPPRPVILGVAALALLFLGAAVYLFVTSPFTGTQIVAPAQMPNVTGALISYRGSILGIEKQRRQVREALDRLGLAGGTPMTIYSVNPLLMRPIDVKCRVGYLLPISRKVEGLPEPIRLETIAPGNCLIARVRGSGNFTGNKAYKAAMKFLRPYHLRPGAGERFEVKVKLHGKEFVEHWIPVK